MNKAVRLRSIRRAGARSFGVRRESGAFTAKAELSLRTPRRGRIQTGDWEGVPPCCTRPKAGLRPAVHKANAELREVCLRFFACSNSATRYGVLRMTLLNGCVAKCTNVVHFDLAGYKVRPSLLFPACPDWATVCQRRALLHHTHHEPAFLGSLRHQWVAPPHLLQTSRFACSDQRPAIGPQFQASPRSARRWVIAPHPDRLCFARAKGEACTHEFGVARHHAGQGWRTGRDDVTG